MYKSEIFERGTHTEITDIYGYQPLEIKAIFHRGNHFVHLSQNDGPDDADLISLSAQELRLLIPVLQRHLSLMEDAGEPE